MRAQSARSDAASPLAGRPSSLWRDAWRRLLRNKLAVAGGVVVILLVLTAVFAEFLAPYSYTKTNFGRLNEAPTSQYPFGTDQLGRDLLSRMIYGARVSMLVGLGAQVIIVLIGVPIGALAGWGGGRIDTLLTRFIDVMYAFPRLLFVILVMSMLGAGLMNIFIAIGLTGWVGIARQTRAQVLALRQKEFVEGARALGARSAAADPPRPAERPVAHRGRHHVRHPEAIFTEAALSFIGVGIDPPTPVVGPDGRRRTAVSPVLVAPVRVSVDRDRDHDALVHVPRRRRARRARSQTEITTSRRRP